VSEKILKLPYRGSAMTVSVIRDAALRSQNMYSVRQLAERICQSVRSKDYVSEMLALLNFVERHTRYMRDPRTVELVRAPYVVVEEINQGKIPNIDCDDMAALLAALLIACGHEARIVTVAFRNIFFQKERQYTHVFVQSKEPSTGRWITLDPVPGPGKVKRMLSRVVAAKVYPVA
jgi:transglutaminase-like putative cysteine protease